MERILSASEMIELYWIFLLLPQVQIDDLRIH